MGSNGKNRDEEDKRARGKQTEATLREPRLDRCRSSAALDQRDRGLFRLPRPRQPPLYNLETLRAARERLSINARWQRERRKRRSATLGIWSFVWLEESYKRVTNEGERKTARDKDKDEDYYYSPVPLKLEALNYLRYFLAKVP